MAFRDQSIYSLISRVTNCNRIFYLLNLSNGISLVVSPISRYPQHDLLSWHPKRKPMLHRPLHVEFFKNTKVVGFRKQRSVVAGERKVPDEPVVVVGHDVDPVDVVRHLGHGVGGVDYILDGSHGDGQTEVPRRGGERGFQTFQQSNKP